MTELPISISPARDAERPWAARLMAASEPWLRLGRTYEVCLETVQPQPDTILFVARTGSAPCGFILMRSRGVAGSPYVVSVAVEQAFRGRGIGTSLLAHVEEYFRPGSRHLFLCVSSFNTAARRLYERLGYAAVGELPDYVITGASEILMHKRLREP